MADAGSGCTHMLVESSCTSDPETCSLYVSSALGIDSDSARFACASCSSSRNDDMAPWRGGLRLRAGAILGALASASSSSASSNARTRILTASLRAASCSFVAMHPALQHESRLDLQWMTARASYPRIKPQFEKSLHRFTTPLPQILPAQRHRDHTPSTVNLSQQTFHVRHTVL